MIDPCEWKHVEWISENQMIPRDGVSLLELDEASRKKELSQVIDYICPPPPAYPKFGSQVSDDLEQVVDQPSLEIDTDDNSNSEPEQIKETISILASDSTGLLVLGLAKTLDMRPSTVNPRGVAHELARLSPEDAIRQILNFSEPFLKPKSDQYKAETSEALSDIVAKLLHHFSSEVEVYITQLKEMLDGLESKFAPSMFLAQVKQLISFHSVFSGNFVKYLDEEKLEGFKKLEVLVEALDPGQIKNERDIIRELVQISVALLYLNGAVSSRFFSTAASLMSVELSYAHRRQSKPDLVCFDVGSDMTRLRGRGAIHEDEIVKEPGVFDDQSDDVVMATLQAATVPLYNKALLISGRNSRGNHQTDWEDGLDMRTAVLLKRLEKEGCCPYFVSDENNLESIFGSEALITRFQQRYSNLMIEKYNGKHLSEEEAELSLSLEDLMDKLKG